MAEEKDDKITSGILGLGGAPVPKSPGDPSTEHDAESQARRRERMREGLEDTTEIGDVDRDHRGATGIDMGSGGTGTDVSGH